MRTQRIEISSPELDKTENEWWNTNAEIVEAIWAHSNAIQQSIRLPYLKKAKLFLQEKNSKNVIWEVGCGSGWVCRMIADENFHILGTDFSKAQIELATKLAKQFKKDQFCKYEISDASSVVTGHNGVVISALLHHLTKEELERFFKVIELQAKGTKVFIYEPVFIQSSSDSGKLFAFMLKQSIKVYKKIVNILINLTARKNQDLINKTKALSLQAANNNWFLSPKEVPFYEDELDNYLNRYFTLEKKYFVNSTDFEIAQNLIFHNIHEPNIIFRKIILPFATWLDRIYFKSNFRAVSKGEYFFCCFELVVK